MAIRRYPFDVFDEMERLMEQMRQNAWGTQSRWGLDSPMGQVDVDFAHSTPVTLEKTEEGYVVYADVPGFEKEEIDLRFEEGVLHISAAHEVEGEGFSRSRRVSERVRVPGDVMVEDISAAYRNGVLEVTLPVVAEIDDDAHRIDID
jgi:HSP20 family protein